MLLFLLAHKYMYRGPPLCGELSSRIFTLHTSATTHQDKCNDAKATRKEIDITPEGMVCHGRTTQYPTTSSKNTSESGEAAAATTSVILFFGVFSRCTEL